ncbi:MAG: ferrous iron transport protein B [Desulfobacteraceae bacterium]|nr:ferrous iron transport protein B [Desulfobacteraceae bacterium]
MLKSAELAAHKRLIALAGQPNCGKSTVFNAITGASQHVANYPGVTVEKLSGSCSINGSRVEIVDLPGTYSLTSFSPEEKVSRDFILHDKPETIINVADASSIKRSLYLTFQLLEMETPVILDLNMMDVAVKKGMTIDAAGLARELGIPVVPTAIKRGEGKKTLIETVDKSISSGFTSDFKVDYGPMEPAIEAVSSAITASTGAFSYPLRWLAIKLMEGDTEVEKLINATMPESGKILDQVKGEQRRFSQSQGESPEKHIAYARYREADRLNAAFITQKPMTSKSLTDKIDAVVCHKFLGPVILALVVFALYNLSIVQGYKITNYTWPLLAKLRIFTEWIMPDPGFITEPMIRSLSLWFVDSVNALLNYVPIFFILFSLIAILEDSGYMPRMAFILDRLLARFGLHGQSTLPMVLGGVYVGGCAVPAIMSTKGIPDEKARFATMMIIPMLNCLAKIPLYILIINIYFADHKSLLMVFIATITLMLALPVAKILTMTLLKNKPSEPFIMELPTYHLPTVSGVLKRALERIWMFLKKIVTIVAAVAVVIFALLQFPGLTDERKAWYDDQAEVAMETFHKKMANTSFGEALTTNDSAMELILFADRYKNARMGAGKAAMAKINTRFKLENPTFHAITTGKGSKEAKKAKRTLKKLSQARKKLLRGIKQEKIRNSFLGKFGQALEPVTQWAGFNWRVNIALLSSFAAKESTVATLGVLYQQEADMENQSLEKRMKEGEKGFTQLHALALLLMMALFPPCVATMITMKIQSGSVKMMLISFGYQSLLGFTVAASVFTISSLLGLTGLQAMFGFWFLALLGAVAMGFINPKKDITI